MLLNWLKKTIYFIWHFHRKLVINLIISLAVVLLMLNGSAWYLENNPKVIKSFVETHLKTKVTFDEIKVTASLFYPSVSMTNFSIKNDTVDENLLELKSAKIRLNTPLSVLHGQFVIDTLALKGFNVNVHRNIHGELSIADFQLAQTEKNNTDSGNNLQYYFSLLNQTNFIISESEVYFIDEMKKMPEMYVSAINLKMKNDNDRHQVSLSARLNESDTFLDFRLDFNGALYDTSKWDGQIYAAIKNLNEQALLHFLQKDILQIEEFQLSEIQASTKIWTTINKGKLQSVYGDFLIEDAKLKRVDTGDSIHFDNASTHFKLERGFSVIEMSGDNNNSETIKKASEWVVDLYDLNISVNSEKISEKYVSLKFNLANESHFTEAQLNIDYLKFGEFSNIVSFFAPKEFNEKIYSFLKLRGDMENLIAEFKFDASEMPIDIQDYQVQADINHFGMNSVLALPKIRNFSTQVIFNETRGRAVIDSSDMKLFLHSMFRDSWPIDKLSGEIFWQKEGDEWLFGAEKLFVKSPHYDSLNADLNLWISESSQIFMDLTAFYENVDVEAISNYVPAKIMSKGLVEWLDYSLISGLVPDGGIVFRGNLNEFPYINSNGNMDIVFNTQNVLLEYLKNWPKLSEINAQVQFTQKGMNVDGRHSKLFSAQSSNVRVDLDDYLERILLITSDIKSSLDDGIEFLQQSKLVSKNVLDMIVANGEIDINLDLKIPLEDGKVKHETKTRIKLNNVDYYPPGFDDKNVLVSQVNGNLLIHNQSVNSEKLTAKIMGLPAKVIIKTDKLSSKSRKDPNTSINIDSEISIKQLEKYRMIPESLTPLTDRLSGKSNLKLNIDLPNTQRPFAFNLYSSLKNIRSDLPAPFTKQSGQESPFLLSYSELKSASVKNNKTKKTKSALLKVKYSKALSLVFLLDAASNLDGFGLLKGSIAFEEATAKLPKEGILQVIGALKHLPFDQWKSVFDSPQKNKVTAKSAPVKTISIPIEIAMTELILPEVKFETDGSLKHQRSPPLKAEKGFVPEFFPLLNGYINSVKIGTVDLGRFNIKSSRTKKKGIIFDELLLSGELVAFTGKGKWHYLNNKLEVDLEGQADIPSLEKLAIAFGNDRLIRQGKATASGYVSWPGGLNDVSYESIEGKLYIHVEKGAWIEGKPGPAGRLLGLLNMNAFARRLSLDFSDVSKDGFEFDLIEGDFNFKKGMAHTDNLLMDSPSAKILVRGSTGLVTEDIDQRVTVIPEVSATLPLAGAAVAGPAGAAVVWLGQKILGDQLNKVTAFDYTIKGNWNEPVIKKDKTSQNTLNNIQNLLRLEEAATVPDESLNFETHSSEFP